MRRPSPAAIIALLAIAALVFLAWRVVAAGAERRAAAAAVIEAQRQQHQLFQPQRDVVLLGDSLFGLGQWADIFPDASLANRGVQGETVEEINARLLDAIALQPRTIIVMGGTNDFLDGASVEEVTQAHRELRRRINPGGVELVTFATLECRRQMCGDRLDKIRALNENLARQSDNFVDINATMADDDGLKDAFTYDGTHLDAYGYRELATYIEPYLAAGGAEAE